MRCRVGPHHAFRTQAKLAHQVMVDRSSWYSAATAKCWLPADMAWMVHPDSPSKGRGYILQHMSRQSTSDQVLHIDES